MKGMYVEGDNWDEGRLVAIKTLKGAAGDTVSRNEKDTLMSEATINAQFDHINIVNLIGVVTAGQPLCIVLEMCPRGELKQMVKKKKVPIKTKLHLLHGVAQGMKYLCELKFIHRDLAARNVLVDAQKNAKVADFGLSRDSEDAEYYVASGGKVPIRWTAVEALTKKKYSEKSDVWSFGIVCHEGGVEHAVWLERDDFVDTSRSGHVQWRDPGEGAGVHSNLVRAANPNAREL